MPRKIFQRLLPSAEKIKNNRFLAPLGDVIDNSACWYLTKHSVSGAFFIGVFCAFLPIPLQSLLAAFLAVVFKRNLPLSVVLVFITNPFTLAPIYYFNYWLGHLLLNEPVLYQALHINDIWTWLLTNFKHISKPLIVGSIAAGLIFGVLSYLIVFHFWVWRVKSKWSNRQQRSKKKK